MPRAPIRHPVWTAYELLTRDLNISHAEAMGRLFDTFTGVPVDLIVAARGDLAITLEQLTGTPPPLRPDTGRPDPRAIRNRIREAIANGQREALTERPTQERRETNLVSQGRN
jgi:hypothetical protein